MKSNIERFFTAQQGTYEIAKSELASGHKVHHYMWWIFPQMLGLGESERSMYYGIHDLNEAVEYLKNDTLRVRLVKLCSILLSLPGNNPTKIFGYIDDMKLQSSMTLFDYVITSDAYIMDNVFVMVLDKYFHGEKDIQTIKLLTVNH